MIYKFVEFVGTDFTYTWKIYFYEDNFIGDFCSNVAGDATHSKEEKEYNVICSKEAYLKYLKSQEIDAK